MARAKRTTTYAGASGVQILGLKELRRDLRAWDNKAPRLITLAHKQLAVRVSREAKAYGVSQGSVAAKAARSIRANATLTSAAVSLGGTRYPFAMGAEFGSHRFPQFKPWRGKGEDAGYFLWPTIRAMSTEIEQTYLTEVADVLRKSAFPIGVV